MQNDGNTAHAAIGGAELLARMAASVASGIESNPAVTGLDFNDVAERSVSIAEAILEVITLRSVQP